MIGRYDHEALSPCSGMHHAWRWSRDRWGNRTRIARSQSSTQLSKPAPHLKRIRLSIYNVVYVRLNSIKSLLNYYYYRAVCNADTVLWWDFCPSVCLSVRPSVCHTRGLWQNGRKIGPDFYTIRKNI